MDGLDKLLTGGGPLGVTSVIAIALIALAALIPKLLNSFKGDMIQGNILDRLKSLEQGAASQEIKVHKFAVKVTKLVVVVIRLEALLKDNNIPIPADLMEEVQMLRKEPEEDI
jgi:hypothetical protein